MLLMLNHSWWCRCHQILIENSSLLLFKLSSTSQLLKRKFERRWEKKWSLTLRQRSCRIYRLREIEEWWWDSLILLLDVVIDAFQLSIVRISERSVADLKILDRMICIKCARVLHIENRASLCDVVFQRKTMYKKCACCASNESSSAFRLSMNSFVCRKFMIVRLRMKKRMSLWRHSLLIRKFFTRSWQQGLVWRVISRRLTNLSL